jgi:hypothetical protein
MALERMKKLNRLKMIGDYVRAMLLLVNIMALASHGLHFAGGLETFDLCLCFPALPPGLSRGCEQRERRFVLTCKM